MTLQRSHGWPEGHWNWPVAVTHKHGVRCGDMIWVGGQVDLDAAGRVLNPGDLAVQTASAVGNLEAVLAAMGGDLRDLVFLLCYYVNDGQLSDRAFLKAVAAALPAGVRTAVHTVPVPYLAYHGLQVEIEGYAMRRADGGRTVRGYAVDVGAEELPAAFCSAVRSGKMIFLSGQYPVDALGLVRAPGDPLAQSALVAERIAALLSHFGAGPEDVVKKTCWFVAPAAGAGAAAALLTQDRDFAEPGPALTCLPLPRLADPAVAIGQSAIAMVGEDGRRLPKTFAAAGDRRGPHRRWGVQCAGMVFVGAQVAMDDSPVPVASSGISAQTHGAMHAVGAVLEAFGATFDDVCKVGAFYRGDRGADELHANLPIRSSYFTEPGPATTGVPLPRLSWDGAAIEVEAFAMVEPG